MLPKILVISHTCFSLNDSMGSTLASYFSTYDSSLIAQFYIKDMVPNSSVCDKYFRITDRELLLKFKKPFKTKVGRVIKKDFELKVSNYSASSDNLGKKNRWLNMMFRDFLWGFKGWKTKELECWVDEFKPDLILCQPGDFSYLLHIALYFKNKHNIPLVIHESESYYLKSTKGKNLFYKIYFRKFKNSYKKLISNATCLVVINEKLMRDYKKHFSLPIYTIMKGSSLIPRIKNSTNNYKHDFVYAGNLGIKTGRKDAIIQIGNALSKFDQSVEVFSSESDYYLKNGIKYDGVTFNGAVSYSELEHIYNETRFAFLIETIDKEISFDLEYAFSTKIADLLASGCCIIAYGHSRIESIDYFKRTNTAFVITENDNIEKCLKEILFNNDKQNIIRHSAYIQAVNFHSLENNSNLFKDILIKCYSKSGVKQ